MVEGRWGRGWGGWGEGGEVRGGRLVGEGPLILNTWMRFLILMLFTPLPEITR